MTKKNLLWLGIPVGLLLAIMGLGWTLNECRFVLGGAFFLAGSGMTLVCMNAVGLLRGAVVMPEVFQQRGKAALEKELPCEYVTIQVHKRSRIADQKSTYAA